MTEQIYSKKKFFFLDNKFMNANVFNNKKEI